MWWVTAAMVAIVMGPPAAAPGGAGVPAAGAAAAAEAAVPTDDDELATLAPAETPPAQGPPAEVAALTKCIFLPNVPSGGEPEPGFRPVVPPVEGEVMLTGLMANTGTFQALVEDKAAGRSAIVGVGDSLGAWRVARLDISRMVVTKDDGTSQTVELGGTLVASLPEPDLTTAPLQVWGPGAAPGAAPGGATPAPPARAPAVAPPGSAGTPAAPGRSSGDSMRGRIEDFMRQRRDSERRGR